MIHREKQLEKVIRKLISQVSWRSWHHLDISCPSDLPTSHETKKRISYFHTAQ